MKAKIAVATVSGKAYYKLVNELKSKNLPFISLKPWDPIPLNVKVVITTKEERNLVAHPNVLTFGYESNPTLIVDKAILAVKGKQNYEKVVIGVDPGKTYGIAVLGDDNVLETLNCSSLEQTINVIVDNLKRVPATVGVVKVGNGAPAHTEELLHSLAKALPQETAIEIVSETGTSRFTDETAHRRGLKDAMSAIEIARRNGQSLPRKKT